MKRSVENVQILCLNTKSCLKSLHCAGNLAHNYYALVLKAGQCNVLEFWYIITMPQYKKLFKVTAHSAGILRHNYYASMLNLLKVTVHCAGILEHNYYASMLNLLKVTVHCAGILAHNYYASILKAVQSHCALCRNSGT